MTVPLSAVSPAPLWDVWEYLTDMGIDGLEIRANEAIDISASTWNAVQVRAAIENQIQTYHWFVTRMTSRYLLIEPRYTSKFFLQPGGIVYHVTKRANRAIIAKKGLEPQTGGGTRMNRRYPPRIFFATDIHAAFQFVDFQSEPYNKPVAFNADGSVKTWTRAPTVGRRDQHLYRVVVPDGVTFYRDVLFPGMGVWCESVIAPNNLARLRFWRTQRTAINWIASL